MANQGVNHAGNAPIQATPNMTVTGQTFLVPTIKVPRSTTPETIHQSLSNAMGASPAARNVSEGMGAVLGGANRRHKPFLPSSAAHTHPPTPHPTLQLLSGKGNGVPLVVDIGEFVPDGSPHFKPLKDGELASLLMAMKQNSLHPIAITSSSGTLPNSMEVRTWMRTAVRHLILTYPTPLTQPYTRRSALLPNADSPA